MDSCIPSAEEQDTRAAAIAAHGSLRAAIEAGAVPATATATLAELVVLGLLEQDVRTYIGILGHGSTTLGEALRVYEAAGVVRFAAVRHETEAAHAASALRIATGERAAVVTSIGPGALHAFAGSLTSALNGVGVWHIYGDATTEAEGPNMQDLPGSVQSGWQRLTSTMGGSYSLHTPQALTHALQQGAAAVDHPYRAGPFFLLLPLNTQPQMVPDFNLRRLPRGGGIRLGAAEADRIASGCPPAAGGEAGGCQGGRAVPARWARSSAGSSTAWTGSRCCPRTQWGPWVPTTRATWVWAGPRGRSQETSPWSTPTPW